MPASDPPRIKGWLLLLSRILIVLQPLNAAVVGMSALNALSVRGPAVAVILAVRALVAAVGIGAGTALKHLRPGAIALATGALVASAATDLFVYTTPYFPNNRKPGDTIYYVAGSLLFHAAWIAYLFRSRQVRELFQDDD